MKSIWVFGYGSLIWGTGSVKPVERREGTLNGWHRDWTWISASRHGAPTCSLRPGGAVHGVFYRLAPSTGTVDLENFRRRERRETEQVFADVPEIGAVTYTWTMGSNLEQFPELKNLSGSTLARALADRARRTTRPGLDGILPTEYIERVHEFDPGDPITAALIEHLSMRVLIAGGGTGGHVIPALAIARELKALENAEVLFVGTARGMENRLVPQAGFELALVKVGALKNVSMATRLRTLFDLPRAILQARKIIRKFRPDVVIGVGGYASGPAMAAAILGRIPTLAFEPNLVPGFANRMVGRRVSAAAVHFEQTRQYFRDARVVGVPVRQEFFTVSGSTQGHPPTLLVFGGSQGAHSINQAVTAAVPEVLERLPDLHVIHQTGERDYNEVHAAYSRAGIAAEVSAFIDNMPQRFAGADLLVCRSGASTVAEVTAAGKPAIFIPFPRAADDHQRRNAEAIAEAGAALLLPESELTPARLADTVVELLSDPARLREMGAKARQLSHPHAAAQVAQMAMGLMASQ